MYIQVSSLFAGINEYAYLLHSSVEGKVKRKNILHSTLMSRPYLRRSFSPTSWLSCWLWNWKLGLPVASEKNLKQLLKTSFIKLNLCVESLFLAFSGNGYYSNKSKQTSKTLAFVELTLWSKSIYYRQLDKKRMCSQVSRCCVASTEEIKSGGCPWVPSLSRRHGKYQAGSSREKIPQNQIGTQTKIHKMKQKRKDK